MSKKQPEKLKIYGLYQHIDKKKEPKLCFALLKLDEIGFEDAEDIQISRRGNRLYIELSEEERTKRLKSRNKTPEYRVKESHKGIKRVKTIKKL